MVIHISSKGIRSQDGSYRHKRFGDLCLPNWVWVMVKDEAKARGVSEHRVFKDALKEYFRKKSKTLSLKFEI